MNEVDMGVLRQDNSPFCENEFMTGALGRTRDGAWRFGGFFDTQGFENRDVWVQGQNLDCFMLCYAFYATPVLVHTCDLQLYTAGIIHFPYIYKLLPPPSCYFVW